ncbi:MAG TPA: mandelate racemase/muconate lactonizing enzyme family protein [Candidatus Limnocylindrales bacterium]
MKVVALEAFAVVAPAQGSYWGAQSWSSTADPAQARRRFIYSDAVQTVLVRIETSDGVVGWGESKAPVGAVATATIVRELLAPIAVGSRIDEITLTWDRMYTGMRVRGHDAGFWLEALSGVDIALWDALGRSIGRPVHTLIGGRYRAAVPVYASGIPAGLGVEKAVELARTYRERGYTATKVAIGSDPRQDVAVVEAVCGIMESVYADAAGTYDLAQALTVGRELSRLGAGFFEMPIAPEFVDGYAVLAAKLDIPLALDSLPNRYRAKEFLLRNALHVLQPDVCRAGGITELMRIASLADSFGAQATPHVSIGSAVHFAASLHCAAAIPNLSVMEHWAGDNPLGTAIAPEHATPVDGLRAVTDAPGLGITVDEEVVRRYSV